RIHSDGALLYANRASAPLLDAWGCAPGRRVPDALCETVEEVLRSGAPAAVEMACGRSLFVLTFTPLAEQYCVGVHGLDITEERCAARFRDLTARILERLNRPGDSKRIIADVLQDIRDTVGVEAVAIRLHEGSDYPYFLTRGFTNEFVEAEERLCTYASDGAALTDDDGRPILACMCGSVLQGRVDPALPFFTAAGSFWSNNTTELLATTTEAERQTNTRNRCNGEGYESVALIPLRSGQKISGLLQLNDTRTGAFTAQIITFLEQLGASIGVAVRHQRTDEQLQQARRTLEAAVDHRTAELATANAALERQVAEREDAEEKLRRSEARHRALVEQLPAVTYVAALDDVRTTLYVSPQAEALLGYAVDTWTDRPSHFADCLHPEDRERVLAALRRVRETGGPFRSEYRMLTRRGEAVWLRDEAALVPGAAGEPPCLQGVMLDVTEQRKLEAHVLQAQKLESLAVLSGGIAHDFNNTLNRIVAHIHHAAREALTPEESRAILRDAEAAALRAGGLTHQLLAFSTGGAPVRAATPIAHLLRETVEFALTGSPVHAGFDIEDSLPDVDVDAGQIGQVVQNIVINARQAMSDGGTVRVAATAENLSEPTPFPLAPGTYVHVAISDSGDGIPDDVLPRVFDPFFTTKATGSGLGLAICHAIVRKHEGHLAVESRPGDGAAFHIYLPTGGKAPALSDAPPPKQADGRRVLLMDDDPVREITALLLSDFGYAVSCATEGAEALRVYNEAAANGGPFDVVLLDLTVPEGMGGKECLEALRRDDPNVRAIVCSGYTSREDVERFRELGFCSAVPKPYSVEQLHAAIQTALMDR
ncbi:PAS domain-containing protein, partial [bacterium]|nr:PAS domain-containing protein [bacterium]